MNEKVLFLWIDKEEYYAKMSKSHGIDVDQIFTNSTKALKIIRRIFINLNITLGMSLWLAPWHKEIYQYTTIIIHANRLTSPVVKYIRRKNKDIRIVVWYWNPLKKSVPLDKFQYKNIEVWSFDESDCREYNLKHNTQYFFKEIAVLNSNPTNDVFFVGGDKGRIEQLISLKNQLTNLGISSNFHVIPTDTVIYESKDFYSKVRLSYNAVLEKIGESKAILDIVSEDQIGLTLRPLEALFLKKKLVTNDKSIIERDFYIKENIFILGYDDMNYLKRFIDSDFVEVNDEVVNKYDFDNWLSRFFIQ